jgi:uncharacterized protein
VRGGRGALFRHVEPLPLLLIALGAGAGVLGALLGVGGGVILVPALIFLVHEPFHAAVGTSLVCVVATSVAGSAVHFRRRAVDPETALRLQAFAAAGAVAAALGAPYVPVQGLFVAFAALMAAAAWQVWPTPGVAPRVVTEPHGPLAKAISGGAGLIGGLLGVGGGIVFVPLLHGLAGLDFHRAAATSIYLIGLTAGSGAVVYLVRGDVDLPVVAPTMLGVLLGAVVASKAARRVSAAWLKGGFAILLLYVAARMLLRAFTHA